MGSQSFDARIKQKRDTSAKWTENDPILLNGEVIIVDTASGEVRTKTGDGTKKYSQLPFDDEVVRNLITEVDAKVQVSATQPTNATTGCIWIDIS